MNYRHIYHAGNFADVVKHAVLALLVEHLLRKDTPFRVLDTHAGLGVYDLTANEAERTGEFRDGIGRLLAEPDPPAALAPYLRAVALLNGGTGGSPRLYPGSPWLVRSMLRDRDRLVAVELHPEDAATLAATFRHDRGVGVHQADAWQALKAFLPPPERRGLVLMDPPFEARDEFERLADGLARAHRRFATGILAAWYPIKDPEQAATLHRAVQGIGVARALAVELLVRSPVDRFRLNGCGLVVVNPPWRLDETLGELMPFLTRVLAQDSLASGRVHWLVQSL
ncbi:MAG: 23S rRNA (adenine(2030)-N(6))-methyltransferase RlmJ [Alphaproteobacteria bacterium]